MVSVLGVSVQGVSVWGIYILGGSVWGVHVREGYVLEPVSDSLSLRPCDAVTNDGCITGIFIKHTIPIKCSYEIDGTFTFTFSYTFSLFSRQKLFILETC